MLMKAIENNSFLDVRELIEDGAYLFAHDILSNLKHLIINKSLINIITYI